MYLTKEEKRLLKGEMGAELQEAISGLIKLGETFNADRMVEIHSAHIDGLPLYYDEDRIKQLEQELEKGLRFRCPTTTNAVGFDNASGIDIHSNVNDAIGSPEFRSKTERSLKLCSRMGAKLTCTCAPYVTENPPFGKSIAWTESGAFILANSFYGSRTNREGLQGPYWSALLGRTPRFGMHCEEFRRATILFELKDKLRKMSDYGALGYYIGENANMLWEVPAILGCKKPTKGQLNNFVGGLSSSGAVAMFHMVGVTPEAPSVDVAFGGEKPRDNMPITSEEIEYVYDKLNTADDDHVQIVLLGCPHATIEQLGHIAVLLKGKRINKLTRLWVHCPPPLRREIRELGYDRIIMESGGTLLCGSCLLGNTQNPADFGEFPWKKNIDVIATDSAKMAHYAHLIMGWEVWFGSTEKCIDAAVSGRW